MKKILKTYQIRTKPKKRHYDFILKTSGNTILVKKLAKSVTKTGM
eukprot:UN20000